MAIGLVILLQRGWWSGGWGTILSRRGLDNGACGIRATQMGSGIAGKARLALDDKEDATET